MSAVFAQYIEVVKYLLERRYGSTYDDICNEFGISRSTAQRIIRELKDKKFKIIDDDLSHDGKKLIRLLGVPWVFGGFERDIHDLGLASDLVEKEGRPESAKRILALRNQLLGALQKGAQLRIDTDLEVLGQEEGWAMRPAPHATVEPEKLSSLREALISQRLIKAKYKRRGDSSVEKEITEVILEPHGILFGGRNYLVAFAADKQDQRPRLYVIQNLTNIGVLDQTFKRREGFDFKEFTGRSFGVWQERDVYDVVWRFPQNAADDVMNYHFHPTQQKDRLHDGRIEVRFKACGLHEMAFHLFTWEEPKWGRSVEIVEPPQLRETYRALLTHALQSMDMEAG